VEDDELVRTFETVDESTPGAARAAIAEFTTARVRDDRTLAAIILCVSEAVSNVLMHAYRGRDPGGAVVKARIHAHEVWIAVCDSGLGLIPRIDRTLAAIILCVSEAVSDVLMHA